MTPVTPPSERRHPLAGGGMSPKCRAARRVSLSVELIEKYLLWEYIYVKWKRYMFTPNRQLIPTHRAISSVVIIGTMTCLKVSAASQLRCRQRKGHFVGDDSKNQNISTDFKHCRQRIRHFLCDNEIADLGITATENGQTVP